MSQRAVVAALNLIAIAMAAGVVHVASLLIVPRVAPDDAYGRLASAPEGTVTALAPGGSAGSALPGRDPSLSSAVCRYDLGRGPLRVAAGLGDAAFVALTLHSRSGVAFYGLTDASRIADRLGFVVMTAGQIDELRARDGPDAPSRDIRVVAPEPLGFVMFDVMPRVGGEAAARRALSSMSCRVDRAP